MIYQTRIITSSGREVATVEYADEPGTFYVAGAGRKLTQFTDGHIGVARCVQGPFLLSDRRFSSKTPA